MHGAADSGLRTEVGDGAAAVVFAQQLLAVIDGAVDEANAGEIVDARVALRVDAELAVEIARDHGIAFHHLMHDLLEAVAEEAEHRGEPDSGGDFRSESRLPQR